MSRRREKKRLLCKTGIVCAVILGVGLGSFFVERISAETAVKQAQTSKAEVTEKQIPSLTATDGTGSTRNPDEPEYYDGLGYDVIYRDKAELVGDDEKEAVLASMEPISEYANVIFYTTDEYEASDTATVCEKICAGYYGSSKKAPVVMFAIDMYNREIYLYCTGPTRHIIRNRDANSITDNIYRLASARRYDDCAIGAFEQCQRLLTCSSIRRPMQRINNLFLAIILGFLINYLYLRISRSMTASKEKWNVKPFETNKFTLKTTKECIRTYTYTESESSGSGGGGGFSGGGGSSGGGDSGGSSGGGHSF